MSLLINIPRTLHGIDQDRQENAHYSPFQHSQWHTCPSAAAIIINAVILEFNYLRYMLIKTSNVPSETFTLWMHSHKPQWQLPSYSLLVLESLRVCWGPHSWWASECWGPHSWSWRAAGCAGVLTPGPGELGSGCQSAGVLTPGPGEPQGVLGSSLLVLESLRVCWGPHSWSWRASGCAGVLTPGPGEPQGVLGSSLLVLESRRVCWGPHSWSWRAVRVCWGPHSWSWRAAGCAGVLTPGPGEPQGVLGSSLLVLESRRVCWGPHSWSWRAAWRASGCAGVLTPGPGEPQGVLGVLTPGPGEPQGVLGSSLLVLEGHSVCRFNSSPGGGTVPAGLTPVLEGRCVCRILLPPVTLTQSAN